MRITLLILLLLIPVASQSQKHTQSSRKPCVCTTTPAALYRPVVHAIWERDEDEKPHLATGYIRIAIRPAWDADFILDIRLNTYEAPTIVTHTLPRGVKTLNALIEKALKTNPCVDATTLARTLPMEKRTYTANQRTRDVIAQLYTLRLAPKPISDVVRLDTTEYEVEFFGDYSLIVNSDDYENPMVKWAQTLISAVNEAPDK